jgi:HK97 family phage prohead protease
MTSGAGHVTARACHPGSMATRAISIDLNERERKEAAASRRFPVSVSSENPVPRYDWRSSQTFDEVLSHARGAVDLSRAPLPLLEGHDRSKVNVGIVTGLRLDGARLRGELVLGESQRARELAADIAAGIVTGLSVGYRIDTEERDEKAKRITATRWVPFEVSIVSVPADLSVGINRSHPMPEPVTPPSPSTATLEPEQRAAVSDVGAERERVRFIMDAARTYQGRGIDDEFTRNLIDRGTSIGVAKNAILHRLAEYSDSLPPTSNHLGMDLRYDERSRRVVEMDQRRPIVAGEDRADDFQRAAVDAILIRSGIQVEKPHAAARDVSASVPDIARTCLSRAGKSASRMFGGEARGVDLLKRAMSTSDFPLILSGALHASVRHGYETEPSTHRGWVRTAPVSDFRDQVRPILGSAPELKPVIEGGEYTNGAMDEDSTSYKVAKYGRIVTLSFEVLVNDNLGAFLRVQPALGQAARRKEADTVYALFALNAGAGPAMQDGVNLFHATHANLVAQGAFDAVLLGKGRELLRKQTALGGGYLSLVPRFLIVPAERETAAEVLLANATRRTTTEKTTPEWIANLELVVEPRLVSSAAFLAADSNQIDTVELGLLEENMGGPVLDEEEEFRRDVKCWKVRHVFGAKALDWRGLVKMPIAP